MKKFLIKLSYTVLPVFLLLFGLTAYVTLNVLPKATGDLGYLALIPLGCNEDDADEMKELLYMNVNQSDSLRDVHADVLTVGDSFSRMGRLGYQNYLAAQGVSVVNCTRELYENPMQYAYNILDMGLVDSTNISVLVVQVGERDLASRAEEFDVDKVDMNVLDPEPSIDSSGGNPNAWSLLRARDFLMYRLYWSPVYKVTLDKDFFNSKEPRSLYFYCQDITNGVNIGEASKQKIQKVFQILMRKAEERGIALLLMIPVDKYDLYQDHIVDNPYPRKTYVEDAREIFGDTPNVLLCKDLLTPLIERGEKDVFSFDDSHWSIKAAEIVGIELSKRVKRRIDEL
jgi:hypothetical protein